MARFDSEREFIEHFDDRYQKVLAPVMLDIEEETQGTRSGASSWSTPAQVERFAAETRLTPGHLLLEVGWEALQDGGQDRPHQQILSAVDPRHL